MNCEFCHKPLRFSHHENNKEIEVYDCNNCPVLTSFHYLHKDGSPVKTTFMLDRNEKCYLWTNNYILNISYIHDLSIPLAREGRDPMILKFPKIMNINPDNVHEKFSFYMVFL
jgi:hypothetical protein